MPQSPFAVNVATILRKPGSMRELELDIVLPERIGEGVAKLDEGSELAVDVRLETLHDGILASGHASGTMTAECVRCLDPISEPMEVDFTELFAYAQDEAYEYVVHDDTVDLEPPIRDAVVLALPFQPVCTPDCLGLDPATGEKLTQPLPEPDEETDPRWAALEQLVAPDASGQDSGTPEGTRSS